MDMEKRVKLSNRLLCFLILLLLCNLSAVHGALAVRLCGQKLVNIIKVLCNHKYVSPQTGKDHSNLWELFPHNHASRLSFSVQPWVLSASAEERYCGVLLLETMHIRLSEVLLRRPRNDINGGTYDHSCQLDRRPRESASQCSRQS